MKIVTFNLHYGGHTRPGNHWQKIISEFAPDLVLAQESFHPSMYIPESEWRELESSTVWQSLPSKWGSAIFALRHMVEKVSVPKELEGWLAGGNIRDFSIGGVARPVIAFSLHTPSPGPYEKKVHEILDFIEKETKHCNILIGGDFNVTTAVRHPTEKLKNTKTELSIIDRLRTDFGLINAWQAINPNRNLPQTLRWTGNVKAPYHCDGIFIPASWLHHLESCEVHTEGEGVKNFV